MDPTQSSPSNNPCPIISLIFAIAVGTVMAGFVPISHVLKHFIGAEPRFHHLVALKKVREKTTDQELVLATTDRPVMPFIDRIADQFKRGSRPQPAAYIIFPQVNFDPIQVSAVIADFACVLSDRDGRDIFWGVESENLKSFDQRTGRGIIRKDTLLGPFSVEFAASEVLYKFFDGQYLRLDVIEVTARLTHFWRIFRRAPRGWVDQFALWQT